MSDGHVRYGTIDPVDLEEFSAYEWQAASAIVAEAETGVKT